MSSERKKLKERNLGIFCANENWALTSFLEKFYFWRILSLTIFYNSYSYRQRCNTAFKKKKHVYSWNDVTNITYKWGRGYHSGSIGGHNLTLLSKMYPQIWLHVYVQHICPAQKYIVSIPTSSSTPPNATLPGHNI